jgi:exo-beta-1,3-glucanase (GH17 family)
MMIPFQPAICYSGYRKGQSPRLAIFPSDQDVLQDLKLLSSFVSYIRMYDTSYHVKQVLRLIVAHNIPLKVMLGVEPLGEIDNPNCHYGGRHSDDDIKKHKVINYEQIDDMITLSETYSSIILALSVGNENTSDWHHNLMPEASLVDHVRYVKSRTTLPVTFCEGAYYWKHNHLLADTVDFISIHSYPMWQKISLNDSFEATKNDYTSISTLFPNKQVIFTELGWTTTNDSDMMLDEASEANQQYYLNQVTTWSKDHQIPMFLFEAFDEAWKGSSNPNEPEKHWGIFYEDRTPKLWQKEKPKYEL